MVIKNETPKETSSSTTSNAEDSNPSSDDSQLLSHDGTDHFEDEECGDDGDFDCKTPENEANDENNPLELKEVESNNNCITSSWNYYYPAASYYLYEIDSAGDKVGGASEQAAAGVGTNQAGAAATPHIMATAAVVEQEVFTSSDLPLQGPYPAASGVPGGHHNDLFVNPAFAHMSFLPDGSMVGPSGEVYTPAEYFPSLLVEQPQDVPAVIPVSPQPRESYPGTPPPPQQPPAPPGVGKNDESILWYLSILCSL